MKSLNVNDEFRFFGGVQGYKVTRITNKGFSYEPSDPEWFGGGTADGHRLVEIDFLVLTEAK